MVIMWRKWIICNNESVLSARIDLCRQSSGGFEILFLQCVHVFVFFENGCPTSLSLSLPISLPASLSFSHTLSSEYRLQAAPFGN